MNNHDVSRLITYHDNYLYSIDTDTINNKALVDHCLRLEKYLVETLPTIHTGWYGNLTTAYNREYNLLTLPGTEFNELYHSLIKHVGPFLEKETRYMIKSWLNVFRINQKIEWHDHWPAIKRAWHGFYCAQVGESYTYYKIPNCKGIIKVPSVDGRIVFGKSEGDQHSSSEWRNESMPRLTLAFDIIPVESIEDKMRINHFIPFI